MQVVSYVPPEIIDEVRSKTDIIEIISQNVSLKKQGRNYVGLCPFHLEDTPSFTVSPEKQMFYCFGCQKGGNVIKFIMELENLNLPDAVEKLAEKIGVVIPSIQGNKVEQARQSENKRLMDMHEIAVSFFHNNLMNDPGGQSAQAYLAQRGVTRDIIIKFQLGYASNSWDNLKKHLKANGFTEDEMLRAGLVSQSQNKRCFDKFRKRLMFPIWDYRGKVIAFGGRIMGDELPKYLNSSETSIFNKSHNLYGINVAAGDIRECDEAIIMEGYMDVIAAHQFGIQNAVASLGTSFTTDQGKLLKRYCKNVLIAYDADSAGAKATYRGMQILHNLGFRVRVLNLPNGLDPDEFLRRYNKAGWMQLVQNKALSLLEYKLHLSMGKHNVKSIAGKADVVKELLPDLQNLNSQVEKDQYIKFIASKLDISEDTVYADLRKFNTSAQNKDKFITNKHTNNTYSEKVEIAQKKSVNALSLAEKNLCKLMIENSNTFERVENELGLEFSEDQVIIEILKMVKKISHDFNWMPNTLIDMVENTVLKEFLFTLYMEDYPEENKKTLIRDYIKIIKINNLQKRIKEVEKELDKNKQNVTSETIQLLQEYTRMLQEVQELKK